MIPPQRKKQSLNRQCIGCIVVLGTLIFNSCSDNGMDSVGDTDGPDIRILSPSDGDTLYSNTLIEIEISDQSEIKTATYYVDDVQIAEKSSSPYNEMWYSGYWAPDESYSLKVVAEDILDHIGYSNEVTVFVHSEARIVPQVYQPRDSMNLAAVTTVTFACTPCPGATKYTLNWYCIACPCSNEWCGHRYVSSANNQIGIFIHMPIPPVDLRIEWSIQARWDDDHRSDWSETRRAFIRGAP